MWQYHKTSMDHSKIIDTSETYHAFIPFHHTINRFVFCETGEIDNLSAVGGKVFGWVCAGPRLLKVKCQRSSTFTSLLILKSYWFYKPWFINEGKLLLATSTPSLGAPPNFANSNQAPNTTKRHRTCGLLLCPYATKRHRTCGLLLSACSSNQRRRMQPAMWVPFTCLECVGMMGDSVS